MDGLLVATNDSLLGDVERLLTSTIAQVMFAIAGPARDQTLILVAKAERAFGPVADIRVIYGHWVVLAVVSPVAPTTV